MTAIVCFYAAFAAPAFAVSRTLAGVLVTATILGYTAAPLPRERSSTASANVP